VTHADLERALAERNLRPDRVRGSERLLSSMSVHVVGAGPVGLLLAALLQSTEGFTVRLYEKRREYTRTRMVQLAPYLVADSAESYRADAIDGDSVEAIFDPRELECAMFLAGLIAQRDLPLQAMLDRYELYIYKQWLRVYMRSKMIKHNKDLFESLDDPLALLTSTR
jgi:cation diffusion facilitator CzcD-associated flavoprotein CzcO